MTVDPRTPVLVGLGVSMQRHEDPRDVLEPLDLMLDAVGKAGADALDDPAPLFAGVRHVAVPKGRWRYRNPGGEIARAIGATRATSVLAEVGVLQQTLIGDACRAIAEGVVDTALVVGGDAGYRLLRAKIAGVPPTDRQQDDAPDVHLTRADELLHPAELRAGLRMPVGLYAIIESAYRARKGWSPDAHRDRLARLYARFSAIAAGNPAAWQRRSFDAPSIRDPSEHNPMQAFPYTKHHCSTWNVDQAAAMLLCSVERADALGIGRDRRIFPLASVESDHMAPVSARAELGACPGAGIAGRAALDAAGVSMNDVDLVDLYSCFPVAVETYADALGIPEGRDLTVTGGMAFAGGPFNNYVLQATCRAAQLLREGRGRRAIVSSVSGVLTKPGYGLWAREAGPGGFVHRDVTGAVARAVETRPIVDAGQGTGTIAGYTVLHDRGQPSRGIAVIDVPAGRCVASTTDAAVMARMEAVELCGAPVQLHAGHAFTL